MLQGHEHYHKHKHKNSQEPRKASNQPDVLGKEDAAALKSSRDQSSNHQMKQAVASLREALASKDLDAVNAAAARIAAAAQLVKHQQQQDSVQLDQQQAGWQSQEQLGPQQQQQAESEQQWQQLQSIRQQDHHQQQQQQAESEQQWQQLQSICQQDHQQQQQQQQQQQRRQYYPDELTSQQVPHRSMRPSKLTEHEQQWACASPAAAVQTPDWDLEEAPKYEDRYASGTWTCIWWTG